jgi:hypothetical protein
MNLFLTIAISCLIWTHALTCHARERSPEEKLVARRCSSCHVTIKPNKYTEQELWDAVTKHTKKLRSLTEEEKTAIITYLKKK